MNKHTADFADFIQFADSENFADYNPGLNSVNGRSYMKKRTFVAEMVFSKILIKSLNLAEKPITSNKLAEILSPETPLFFMYGLLP